MSLMNVNANVNANVNVNAPPKNVKMNVNVKWQLSASVRLALKTCSSGLTAELTQ